MSPTSPDAIDWFDVALQAAFALALALIAWNLFELARRTRADRRDARRYTLTSREWIRRTPRRAADDPDPIAELVAALGLRGKPTLGWVIRWSDGGRVEPVLAAWRNATDVFAMKQLLYFAGHDAADVETRFRAAALERVDEMLPDALRRIVAEPPTLQALLARRVESSD